MKKLLIAALVAAQLGAAASPATAAALVETPGQQVGTFAGARLVVPLDGRIHNRGIRAGLALAPAVRTAGPNGESRLRIGEGLELGLASREPVALRLGGVPVSRLAEGPRAPDGTRAGVSTLGWIAIGVGAAALVTFGLFAACMSEEICDLSE